MLLNSGSTAELVDNLPIIWSSNYIFIYPPEIWVPWYTTSGNPEKNMDFLVLSDAYAGSHVSQQMALSKNKINPGSSISII